MDSCDHESEAHAGLADRFYRPEFIYSAVLPLSQADL